MITIYTKNSCVFCTNVKNVLSKLNLSYTECNIDTNYTKTELLQKYPSVKTVPVTEIDDQVFFDSKKAIEYILDKYNGGIQV